MDHTHHTLWLKAKQRDPPCPNCQILRYILSFSNCFSLSQIYMIMCVAQSLGLYFAVSTCKCHYVTYLH